MADVSPTSCEDPVGNIDAEPKNEEVVSVTKEEEECNEEEEECNEEEEKCNEEEEEEECNKEEEECNKEEGECNEEECDDDSNSEVDRKRKNDDCTDEEDDEKDNDTSNVPTRQQDIEVVEVQSEDVIAENEQVQVDNEGSDEWEEGDGQEEAETLTKDNPMFVPRGSYFHHDSRFDDPETKPNEEGQEEQIPVAPRLRCEELDKWDHDMFVAEEQKPREDWEKEKDIKYYEKSEKSRHNREGGERTRGSGVQLHDYMTTHKNNYKQSNRDNNSTAHRDSHRNEHYEEANSRHENDKDHQQNQRNGYKRGGYNRRDEGRAYNRRDEERDDGKHYTRRDDGRDEGRAYNRRDEKQASRRIDDRANNRRETSNRRDESSNRRDEWKTSNRRDEWESSNKRDKWRADNRSDGGSASKEKEDTNAKTVTKPDKSKSATGDYVKVKEDASNKEVHSLFKPVSFATSRVFSLSGDSNRLVVREVDNKITGRRMAGRGRGHTRLQEKSEVGGSLSRKRIESTLNEGVKEDSSVSHEQAPSDEGIINEREVVNEGDTSTNDTSRLSQESSNSPPHTKPVESSSSIPPVMDESLEVDSKLVKPKRYSSRRQKPESDSQLIDGVKNMTGVLEHPPPPHFPYGWMYSPPPPPPHPHPSMIPMDPASFQQQQQQTHPFIHQQMLYYQQHMRMLHDMYQHHQGGQGLIPMVLPPTAMIPSPEQFTFPPNMTYLKAQLSADNTAADSEEDNDSPSSSVIYIPPQKQVLVQSKPSQAIPIIAPENTS